MRHTHGEIRAVAVLSAAALLAGGPWAKSESDAAETIRVAVVQSEPEVDLQIHGSYTVRAMHTGHPIQDGRKLAAVAIRANEAGILLGDQQLPLEGLRVESKRDADISVNGKHLRGSLEILRQPDMTLQVINHVPLEDYLRGVLSKEAPDYWPEEALKAIAIAARTYAVYRRMTNSEQKFDVRGDVMSQDYGGKTAEKKATDRAVKATAGMIFLYENTLFPAFYHSTCGGETEHARVMGRYDLKPLKGGITCNFCSASPFYSWQRRLTKADLGWAMRKSPHGKVGQVTGFKIAKRTLSGRVEQVTVIGTERTVTMTGYDLRKLLGFENIRSPLFGVVQSGDDYVLDGRGWGHGVGMCQWGAAELARRGMSAEEILAYYYPGIEIVPVSSLEDRTLTIVQGGP